MRSPALPWRSLNTVALSLLTLTQVGCPSFSDDGYLYREGFQDCPAGCGWVRIEGSEGDVIITETLHGERGMELRGEAAVMRDLEGVVFDSTRFITGFSLALDLIARCDAGSRLEVRVIGIDASGAVQEFRPIASAPATWDRPRSTLSGFGGSASAEQPIVSLNNIVISKSGAGVCEIDEIGVVLDPFQFSR